MEATLPSNRKNLTIEKYDGTTDPYEHLDVYITQASLYTTDDVVLCRVFQMSLKGHTLHWRLPPNSMDSFDTLATCFGIQFATSWAHQSTSYKNKGNHCGPSWNI